VSPALLLTLARTEVRLRLRRISTLVTLLAVVVITWTMISDPAGGMTLLAVNEARVLYTSSTLALGSASLGGMLFSLAGFFLVRGRVGEDLRSGTGSVIAATPVGNAGFLLSRWLGAVAYLGALVLGFLLTTWACHALRGDGPIQPWVYLQTFTLVLLPTVLFTASCAVLFDSWAPLMGKGGDLVYFILWAWQLSLAMQLSRGTSGEVPGLLAFDFPGIGMSVLALEATLHTPQLALGGAPFDPSLPPLTLPAQLWTGPMALMRAATAALALLPLLPAGGLFHRFSPDRVKHSSTRVRRSPLARVNGWLRPLSRGAQPLFRLGAALPGLPGQAVADLALSLTVAPFAIAALLLTWGASLWVAPSHLGPVLAAAVAFWGLLVGDLSTRDHEAGLSEMTGAVGGGIPQRYLRNFLAAFALGLLFTGAIALRWATVDPVRAAAVVSGTLALSALATLLGRLTGTPRTFTALLLFGLYVALSVTRVPMLDVVGFNGAATLASALTFLALGAATLGAGFVGNRELAH
jgi:hypothetical protein